MPPLPPPEGTLPLWLRRAATVVTHGGAAHFDEFAACCVLLALKPALVVKRDGAADRPAIHYPGNCVLVDVGLVSHPNDGLFDHRQFPRDHRPTCSLTLVLHALWLLPDARKFWPWLRFKEVLDSKGPAYAAREAFEAAMLFGPGPPHAAEPNYHALWSVALAPTRSPVEDFVVRLFRDAKELSPGDRTHELMVAIGTDWVKGLYDLRARYDRLPEHVTVGPVGQIEVAVVAGLSAADRPTLALEQWLADRHPAAAVTVTPDDRGPGFCLFRRLGSAPADFSRLEGHPDVTFCHKSGFVAKTRGGLDAQTVLALVALATLPRGGPPCIS